MPVAEYTPRDPSGSVLYNVVRDHFETFCAEACRQREGDGLPRFVDDEFRAFLRCGFLAGGFARFRCGACAHRAPGRFFVQGPWLLPSCGGRRMAERAAHLVDHVLPDAPVRQWVHPAASSALPLAWRHALCRGVVRILHRAIERHLRRRACAARCSDPARRGRGRHSALRGLGESPRPRARAGARRGVRAHDHRAPRFHAAPAPAAADLADIISAVVPAVRRLLARDTASTSRTTPPTRSPRAPLLAGWAAASILGVDDRGQRPRRLGAARRARERPGAAGDVPDAVGGVRPPCRRARARRPPQSPRTGVPLRAAPAPGHRAPPRDGRRRGGRPASTTLGRWHHVRRLLANRLSRTPGRARPAPPSEPPAVPRRARPAGALEAGDLPRPPIAEAGAASDHGSSASRSASGPSRGWRWADLMRRVFHTDVLACPRCGGRLRLMAVLKASEAGRAHLPTSPCHNRVPSPASARAPPGADDWAGVGPAHRTRDTLRSGRHGGSVFDDVAGPWWVLRHRGAPCETRANLRRARGEGNVWPGRRRAA